MARKQQWQLGAILLILSIMWGCHSSGRADGRYEVKFVWDTSLQQAEVRRDRGDLHVERFVRDKVVRESVPLIAEELKKANLTHAEGKLRVVISGPSSDAFFVSSFEISSPSIAALIAAVQLEDVSKIRSLISQYNNVNQRELPSQRTALFMAAAGGRTRSVRALIELGADPNISDFEGDTPLEAAVVTGDQTVVQELIDAGAEVDHANSLGITPLMVAAMLDRVSILELLLRSRANPYLRASNDKTALMFARETGHARAIAILERFSNPGESH